MVFIRCVHDLFLHSLGTTWHYIQEKGTYSTRVFLHFLQKASISSLNISCTFARCLKITEKVSFNIASKASYVYILSGQNLIKNAKSGPFWRVLKTWSLQSNSDTRHVNFNRTKIGGKFKNSNGTFGVIFKQCVHLESSFFKKIMSLTVK